MKSAVPFGDAIRSLMVNPDVPEYVRAAAIDLWMWIDDDDTDEQPVVMQAVERHTFEADFDDLVPAIVQALGRGADWVDVPGLARAVRATRAWNEGRG